MKKKPTSVRFQIPEPCSQPFNKMHPLPGGHYCDKCEKTVVDFTDMSDGEIVRIYQKRQGRVCGVFRNDQLDRSMPLPMTFEKSSNWKAVAAFASALIFSNLADGQTTTDFSTMTKEELFMRGIKPIATKTQTISGWVNDENDVPLLYASIYLNGTMQGGLTNEIGFFSIELPEHILDQEITISYVGFKPQTLLWTKEDFQNKPMNVFLQSGSDLPEVVVTASGSRNSCDFISGALTCRSVINYLEEEKTTEMEEIEIVQEVFPNPFVSFINVKIELEKPEAILFHLYNEAGQLLFANTEELITGTQTVRLNLNQRDLPEGLYFLRISDSIGEIRTKRVVKVRP